MISIARNSAAFAALVLLGACGGGGGGMTSPTATTYDLQTGIANMAAKGLTVNVSLTGTVMVNGVSNAFTGSGTFTRPPGVSATFDGVAASSQTSTLTGTVTAAGQTVPYSTTVTDYYATSDSAWLGESATGEYDVAQSPLVFPTMVVAGSSGVLGTLSRYADSTMGVSLGTVQVSYSVPMAPVDPGAPIGVALTTKIYDATNSLVETDVTNYTLSSSDVLALVSATAQTSSGTITATAQ